MAKVSLLPCQDAYVSEWYANTNFSSSIALFVSQYLQSGDDYRSLLQFTFEQIPPTSTIEQAILELTVYRNEVSGFPINISAHRLLYRWNQYSVTWNSQPRFTEIPDSLVSISSSAPPGKVFFDLTDLVRGWYDGSIPNNGLILRGNELCNDLIAFRSTNFNNSDAWPLLHVNFVDGILTAFEVETLVIPDCPPYSPLEASAPIPLSPRQKATFLIKNASRSHHVKVMLQVGYCSNADATFFDAGPWIPLKPECYPGEAAALTTDDAAEFARVLVRGEGGETVQIWARTYEP